MPVYFRFRNPSLSNAFGPDSSGNTANEPILDLPFPNTATLVTVELWPTAPATGIASTQVFVNSSTTDISNPLTPITGCAGKTLTFNLGGTTPGENLGVLNTISIEVTVTPNPGTVFTGNPQYYRQPNPTPTSPGPTTTTTSFFLAKKKKATVKKSKTKSKGKK